MTDKELILAAEKARENAHVPYSNYSVGAAVIDDKGRMFTGCNIENASYPAGICAERTAIFKAVSEGAKRIEKLALSAGMKGEAPTEYPSPCGICRQVMAEFADAKMPLLLSKSVDDYKVYTLEELLPLSFIAENLK